MLSNGWRIARREDGSYSIVTSIGRIMFWKDDKFFSENEKTEIPLGTVAELIFIDIKFKEFVWNHETAENEEIVKKGRYQAEELSRFLKEHKITAKELKVYHALYCGIPKFKFKF